VKSRIEAGSLVFVRNLRPAPGIGSALRSWNILLPDWQSNTRIERAEKNRLPAATGKPGHGDALRIGVLERQQEIERRTIER
jgi:hypothetical protein